MCVCRQLQFDLPRTNGHVVRASKAPRAPLFRRSIAKRDTSSLDASLSDYGRPLAAVPTREERSASHKEGEPRSKCKTEE